MAMIAKKKFRGTLCGVLAGDCCGAPFEGDEILSSGSRVVLHNYFDKLEGAYFSVPRKSYTDDTALTLAVARHLVKHKTIDPAELAAECVRTYYANTHRGYGRAAAEIFQQFRRTDLKSPLQPARDLFNGIGSFGNGGAMRVAPIALFFRRKTPTEVIEMARRSAEITHTHRHGVNGAILQALAIHQLLNQTENVEIAEKDNKRSGIDSTHFLSELEQKIQNVEGGEGEQEYCAKLKEIARLLRIDPSEEQIVNRLGNSYRALESVPTAIYCFLRTVDNKSTKINPFRQAVQYAITLGGDSDTIASMTGALCGAFYGESAISPNLLAHCEGYEDIQVLSEQLYEASPSD